MPVLDPDKQLTSDLWLDQPDARAQVEARRRAGSLAPEDAAMLAAFVEDGFVRLDPGLPAELFARFDDDLDRVWRERPAGVGVGLPLQSGRCSLRDVPDEARSRHYRLADLHSFAAGARELYVHAAIMRIVELVFDQRAVAFQSLYFERGSGQGLHRDPMFVGTEPRSHLLGVWTALEDITEGSGPLVYVPGSHRMPWFEFGPDEISAGSASPEAEAAWRRHRDEAMADMGLEPRALTCPRGTVFVWHAGLLHGGAEITDPAATRRSFVVHYSTAANYTSRKVALRRAGRLRRSSWKVRTAETSRLVEIDGFVGLESPFAPGATASRSGARGAPGSV